MKRLNLTFIGCVAAIAIAAGGLGFYLQTVRYNQSVQATSKLGGSDVKEAIVYEGAYKRGLPSYATDPTKIQALITSLQSGSRYQPNHDSHNCLERVVTIEPQHLEFRAYQRQGDNDHVIVRLGESTDSAYLSFGCIRRRFSDAGNSIRNRQHLILRNATMKSEA